MSKKVIVIVGMALVIAVSGGVIALTAGNNRSGGNSDASSVVDTEFISEDISETEDDITVETDDAESDDVDTTEAASAPTSFGTVEPTVSFDEQIIDRSMSIKFVVDHSTGAEASARVVFGESFDSCYIVFNADKSFEMCVDPTAGTVRTGTYQIVGEIVSVTYADGTGAEYDILVDESGSITHVIVNYGDYDIYFG